MLKSAAAIVLLAATLAVSKPAAASLFCPILKSPDGFVALRQGPGAHFPIVARMKEDDDVQATDERKGAWIKIRHWWGMDRLDEKKRGNFRDGWMHGRYLGECG
jgi:hypothetical protein